MSIAGLFSGYGYKDNEKIIKKFGKLFGSSKKVCTFAIP